MTTNRAKEFLNRVRQRPNVPRGHRLQTANRYGTIAVGLYQNQIEYLDRLADALKRTKNESRNRSRAIQWLIEQHIVKSRMEKP